MMILERILYKISSIGFNIKIYIFNEKLESYCELKPKPRDRVSNTEHSHYYIVGPQIIHDPTVFSNSINIKLKYTFND